MRGPTGRSSGSFNTCPLTPRCWTLAAGTGGVGELLHQRGYRNLVGLDISAGMLAEARQKKIYSDLQVGILGEPLDLPSDTFDAVISVGLFTVEHPPPPSSFEALIRVTKPGGHIVFLLHNALASDFKPKLEALETAGKWALAEVSPIIRTVTSGKPHPGSRVHVYQV
ncbi:class I SAM-dependent methyltransferase [Chloroflexi bacterium TSY]|nr:class I SAM-dependent methyltransferase [Chloroflexi bacterium TSY]